MILAVVQARMGSTRLSGKVMREISGKPLIGYLLERLKKSEKIDKIVLATSIEPANDALCGYVSGLGFDVFRGSEDDVLDRFYQAARRYGADIVVRVTGDCPLVDYRIVDRVIGLYEKDHLDYAATASDPPGFPDGLDVEVFSFAALETAWKNARLRSEREHVTPYLIQSPGFRKGCLRPDSDHSKERWTVDHETDFLLVKAIIGHFYSRGAYFGTEDILKYRAERPDVFDVNRGIERNEGYKKSVREDRRKGLVSIVMGVYNGEHYLPKQLESLLAQSHPALEIIVLDDASTDGSAGIVEKMAAADPRIRLYRNAANLGLVSNFLKGVGLAGGEFVAFCDQDDVWEPEKTQILKNLLEKDPGCMLAYCDLEVCDERLKKLSDSFWKANHIFPRKGALGARALLKNIAPGCSMLFRREVADLLIKIYQDEDFRRLNAASRLDDAPFIHDHLAFVSAAFLGRVDFVPKVLVRYRQHGGNRIGAFYEAERGGGHFLKMLTKKIEILKTVSCLKGLVETEGLERFARSLQNGSRRERRSLLSYYWYARQDSVWQKGLGTIQCMLPGLYEKMRSLKIGGSD